MLFGAIADDLTGATDLSLTLTRAGMRVLQVVGVPGSTFHAGAADAVVVSLKSRTIAPELAVEQSLVSAQALLAAGARQLFFKYCSTFDSTDKGNIGPVTDALLAFLGETRTIACPAFPANSRTVYKGHLFVGDKLLSESSMRDHPLTPMRESDLVRLLQRQSRTPVSLIPHEKVRAGAARLEDALAALDGIAIVDAITDADLIEIGRACRGLKLVTGGSGVAMGLPANFGDELGKGERTPLSMPNGRSVILAGSCSAATRGQVAYAKATGIPAMAVSPLDIAAGRIVPGVAVNFVMAQPSARPVLVNSRAEPEEVAAAQQALGVERAGALVEAFLAEVATALARQGVDRFLVAGGETSGAVVGALGVRSLEIGPEIDPGVPWTLARNSDGTPFALALKSGNFGKDDFFLKAWTLLP
ncbi:3-oxo-tetronate kinase [Devosia nitrariae]|uniref:3-oxo-tetronate kinase n=1 Tax=Devosia nitrariae TaxID=2071872 RepID=A0ABQ5W7W4_9HYPH|nr:3-oxo-tetronate kinase [Devosia nitrariae]GLQ56184.1 HPr kinase [Devosia nitrariae]